MSSVLDKVALFLKEQVDILDPDLLLNKLVAAVARGALQQLSDEPAATLAKQKRS